MSKTQDVATAEAEFQKAAAALVAANAEKESEVVAAADGGASAPAAVVPAEVVLDKGRAYGTVSGEYVVGETRVRYQQDGLNFDFYGKLIKE